MNAPENPAGSGLPEQPEEKRFEHRSAMFDTLAREVTESLAQAIDQRGEATLVVSGGSTPKPLFDLLSGADLDWSKVTVTLADERWVDKAHKDSNGLLIRETLLRDRAAAARFVSLKTEDPSPEQGEPELEDRLQRDLKAPLDFVLLGMGTDGHTASLFPGGDQLARALNAPGGVRCCAIRAPGAPQARMTLTAPFLLKSRQIAVLCTGETKARVFSDALAPGPKEDLPIRAILRQGRTPVTFYWAP